MTGFALIIWIILYCFGDRALQKRIQTLENEIETLKRERRVILADDIERLVWFSLELPEGTNVVDKDGVREMKSVPVLSFISKNRKVLHG